MSKYIRWQIPFVSRLGTQYRIDIYDEATSAFDVVTLQPGETPFTTDEEASDDFFAPVRSQTGTIQVTTLLPDGTLLDPADIMPQSSLQCPVFVNNVSTGEIDWQGYLSCESFSQEYTGTPQILDIPVLSVLEVMRYVELDDYYISQAKCDTVGNFINSILSQVESELYIQLNTHFSEVSSDVLNKYIFETQFFSYDENVSTGNTTYVYKATPLYDIFSRICQFMGWTLREHGNTLYFVRNWMDELGTTLVNMSSLSWCGTGHQRSISLGAKSVSVEAQLEGFDPHFVMPVCPHSGLTAKNYYSFTASPAWYYNKCTELSVGPFTSENISNCFLSRFYGLRNDSTMPWNLLTEDIGFSNILYLTGQKYSDSSYSKLCTIYSLLDFSVICGVSGTLKDVGHLTISIKEETAAVLEVDGYIRVGLKFLGRYYQGATGSLWNTDPTSTFTIPMEKGSGSIKIEIPRLSSVYSFAASNLELYIYNDFDINERTSALISDISITYEPPFKEGQEDVSTNRYEQKINDFRDDINIQLNLASSLGNKNSLSHLYGVKTYTYGQESVDYFEPIDTLDYVTDDQGTTEARRPENDLLTRLASYYMTTRTKLELEVEHPTNAPLPLLRLNGINDGKVYAPMSESRDWQQDTAKLICMEIPQS